MTKRVSTFRLSSSTDRGDGTVAVGRITRPHGVRGDVLVVSWSDHPDRFVRDAQFEALPSGSAGESPVAPTATSSGVSAARVVLTVATARPHKAGYIIRFAEVADRTDAERLVGHVLNIDAGSRRELEPDEFWPDELIGLRAEDVTGATLGTVRDVVQGVAQDRLVVLTASGDEVKVPFVSALVGDIDTERVVIDPPQGLFP